MAGLDSKFNQARNENLRKYPPLDLESCYAYVSKDHNQRQTTKEPKIQPDGVVHLAARTANSQQTKRKKIEENLLLRQIIIPALILVRRDIPNNVAMKLLGILNGGTI